MKAGDIMTRGAATIGANASLGEAAQVMIEFHISGLPVVDEQGKLVGVVTENDFLRRKDGTNPRWLDVLVKEPRGTIMASELHDRRVADVMSKNPITVSSETPAEKLIDLMQQHGIKRLPVVEDGRVIGIVSRADLLRALARASRGEASRG